MMRKIWTIILWVLLGGWGIIHGESPTHSGEIFPRFTPEEQAWIAQHKVVTLGAHKWWVPYDFDDEFGDHSGIANDILNAVAQISGLRFKIVSGTWLQIMKQMRDRRLDGLLATTPADTQGEASSLMFTKPFISTPAAVVTLKTRSDIRSTDDLADKVVAVTRGPRALKRWLTKRYPHLKLMMAASGASALKAVERGRVDAYIGNAITARYLLQEHRLFHLKIVAKLTAIRVAPSIAVRRDNPILFSIIVKSLEALPETTRVQIIRKWSRQPLTNPVVLTDEEKAYVRRHPVVTVGDGDSWAPIGFVDDGKYVGIAKDYLDRIAEKTGLVFKMVIGNWSDLYEAMAADRNDSVDVLNTLQITKERLSHFNFTPPYIAMQKYFFIRDDVSAKTLSDLDGKTVAIPKHWSEIDFIKTRYPKIRILETESFADALDAVMTKKADLLVDDYAALEYTLEHRGVFNIIPFKAADKRIDKIRMATKKSDPILASILSKALQSISSEERKAIYRKWIKVDQPVSTRIRLSDKEQAWIRRHPVIRFVADPDWAPLEFIDSAGRYQGMARDYLTLISQITSLEFRRSPVETREEGAKLIERRKSDMYSCAKITPNRLKILEFTDPYLVLPLAVVTTIDKPFIDDIRQLNGHTVAVVKGYATAETVRTKFPGIKLQIVRDTQAALEAVSKGQAYAFISPFPVASYTINKYGFGNLKIAGKLDMETKFSIALRNDWEPEGIAIINRALHQISEAEKERIQNKWLSIRLNKVVDYTLLWIVGGVSLLIILIILFWMRSLRTEIAHRRAVEEKLRIAKQKAEEANRAKSMFLSSMSHEIRTPMNAIIGFTDLIDERLDDPTLKKYVKTIKSSGQSLLTLINDILDLSKIEAGKMEIQKQAVDLRKLCRDVASVFTLKLQEKGLKLILKEDESIPDALLLDEVRMRQILLNLIGNAIKFTDRGAIEIRAYADTVKEDPSKIHLKIDVADTGIGIPADQLEKIFGDFEQVDGQNTKRYGGTGLGLAISYRLAKMMGGTLSVTSTRGEGSTFTLTLPRVDVVAVAPERQPSGGKDGTIRFEPAKILVADDIEDNRALMVGNFDATQIAVVTAADGHDAIAVFQKEHPDLILMDIHMPNMDGVEAAQAIKAMSNVPIVALTASGTHEDFERQKGSLFDGFLKKPILKKTLYRELARFLPHTKTDSRPRRREVGDVLDEEALRLLREHTKRIEPLFDQARNTNSFNEIITLSKAIRTLARTTGNRSLEAMADTLDQAIEAFDIVTIERMMNTIAKFKERR